MRGSIRRRGKNSFEIQIELSSEGNKRRRRFVSFKGSYRGAQKELAKLLTAADTGTLPDPTKATIGSYVTAYLDNATDISPKTRERYQELAAKQIIPHLGEIRLQKLRAEDIETWHATLLAGGLGRATVGHAHRVLSKVLRRAVENGRLPRNVATLRRPPRVEAPEIEILTPDQVKAVVAALRGYSLYPIIYLALQTGMRRGELLAIEWRDIDLDRGVLRVERSVEETKSGLRLKPPKTKRGRRNITLPSEAVSALRAHKVKQLETRLALGQGNIAPDTLVFGTIDGELMRPRNLSKAWWRARSALKLPAVSFHAFRHSHASILLRKGVDVLTVSRRLGHANASITLNVYGHLIEGADAAAAKAIEGVLK